MAKVRIEYVRLASVGRANTSESDIFVQVPADAESIDVGASSIQSTAAPDFSRFGPFAGGVYARITCVDGAVVVTAPTDDPIAEQETGIRIQINDPAILFEVTSGQIMAFVESVDPPTTAAPAGGASEATLSDVSTKLGSLITLVTAGNASLTSLVAGTEETDPINTAEDGAVWRYGSQVVTIHHLPVNTSVDADLLAAVSGKRYAVLSCTLMVPGADTLTFTSGTGPTTRFGPLAVAANGGFVLNHNDKAWFITGVNEKLTLDVSAAVAAGGGLVYAIID